MKPFTFANNIDTTLAAALTTSSTTVTLASSAGLPTLPAGNYMPLTLNDQATGAVREVVFVTAIAGATLTVIRAQEGTSAQTWAIGDYAYVDFTADPVTAMSDEITNTIIGAGLTPSLTNHSQLLTAVEDLVHTYSITYGTVTTLTGSTNVDLTGITSISRRATLVIRATNLSAVTDFGLQLYDTAPVTSGYGATSFIPGPSSSTFTGYTTYVPIWPSGSTSSPFRAVVKLYALDTNEWIIESTGWDQANSVYFATAVAATSSALTGVRLLCSDGTSTFSSGLAQLSWE